jgi:hypothetical protein
MWSFISTRWKFIIFYLPQVQPWQSFCILTKFRWYWSTRQLNSSYKLFDHTTQIINYDINDFDFDEDEQGNANSDGINQFNDDIIVDQEDQIGMTWNFSMRFLFWTNGKS